MVHWLRSKIGRQHDIAQRQKGPDKFLEQMKAGSKEVVFKGFKEVNCVETGGPLAGVGCAGRG